MEKTDKTIKVPVTDGGHDHKPRNQDGNMGAKAVEDDAKVAQAIEEAAQDDQIPDLSDEVQADEDQAEEQVEEREPTAEELKDQYMRILAEFDNYKKRSEREMAEFRKFANETLLKELLPVVDNLERAISCATDGNGAEDCTQTLVQGVELTQKEILKVLERFGVTPIEAMGKMFDPVFHQALMSEESKDHPDETIIREMQKGYLLKERLLRPSLVAISKGK